MGTAVSNIAFTNTAPTLQATQADLDKLLKLKDSAYSIGKSYRQSKRELYKLGVKAKYVFDKADANTQMSFETTLTEECKKTLKFEPTSATTYLHMFFRLALGNSNTKDISAMVHVVLVTVALEIAADACIGWLVKEGGFQAVRTTYNTEGKLKKQSGKNTPNKDTFSIEMDEITFAREKLSTAEICTVIIDPKQLRGHVLPASRDTEYTAIVVHRPDGSFAIKAFIQDAETTEAAYAGFMREHFPHGMPPSPTEEEVQILLDKPDLITNDEIRAVMGEEGFQQIENEWACIRSRKEFCKNLPYELKHYQLMLKKADAMSDDKGEEIYEDALLQLQEAIETDSKLLHALDRPVTLDGIIDKDTVPRLLTSKLSAGGLNKAKKTDLIKQALNRLLDELQAQTDPIADAALAA